MRLLALIIPTMFDTSAPADVSDAGQVAVTLFVSRILVEHLERGQKTTGAYATANLYWQSTFWWLVNVFSLGLPMGHAMEGVFEGT